MRHISPAFAALAAVLAFLACPRPAFSQAVTAKLAGNLTHPAVCDGVLYQASDNGMLYAVNANDGSAVAGFPVDISAAVGDGSFPDGQSRSGGRVGIYYGALGKAIYLETSKHGVVKVWPNGTIAWINKLDGAGAAGASSTPVVTTDGEVIAEMKTSANVFVVKLKESDGSVVRTSPPLSQLYIDYISAPAVAGGNVYVTVSPYPAAGLNNRVTVLNLADLTVKATAYGSGSDEAAPYVRGDGVYFGSTAPSGATVFKLNSATLNPDPLFGKGIDANQQGVTTVLPIVIGGYPGVSEVCASPTSADRDPGGTVYASVNYGYVTARVVAIDATKGNVRVLYDANRQGGPGLVVSPRGAIAYGVDKTLKLISVDGGVLKTYNLPGYPGRPCYDPTTNRFFVTTQPDSTGTSYLLGFDSP